MPPPPPIFRWLLAAAALTAGTAGIAALWLSASMLSGRPCAWMGLIAAVEAGLLLRLTGVAGGPVRAVVALTATGATIGLSYWLVVATQLGLSLGLEPLDSARRLGPVLAEAMTRRFLDPADAAMLLLALAVATVLGWRRPANG